MVQESLPSVGVIYYKTYHDPVNFLVMKLLAKRLRVVALPLEEQVDIAEIKSKVKDCKVIWNNAVFDPITFESLELSKTLEELGKQVVNSTHSFFYMESKWMFYLKCLERKLPTPKTFLIPRGTRYNAKQIKVLLKQHPLVLKGIFSSNGEAVERVRTFPEFKKKLKKILKFDSRSPVIAQEYIENGNRSYRVTLIGKKVKQAVVKIGKNWKQTGEVSNHERFRGIQITKKLEKVCERAAKAFRMDICGLDLVHGHGQWYIIEANSCPALDFINDQQSYLVKEIADFLYRKTSGFE